jgi:tetratricopeptide (TPR) repeat protein
MSSDRSQALDPGKVVGLNVRRLRTLAGLGVRALASRARISAAYVSALEGGRISDVPLERVGRLASALGADAEGLTDREAVLRATREKVRGGEQLRREGCFQPALQLLDEALDVYEATDDRAGAAEAYVKLGDVYREMAAGGDERYRGQARSFYRRAYERIEPAMSSHPSMRERSAFALASLALSRTYLYESGMEPEAHRLLSEAKSVWEEISRDPDRTLECPDVDSYLSVCYRLLGRLAENSGDPSTAETLYSKALEVTEQGGNRRAYARAMLSLAELALTMALTVNGEEGAGKFAEAAERARQTKKVSTITDENFLWGEMVLIRAGIATGELDEAAIRERVVDLMRLARGFHPAAVLELAKKLREALSQARDHMPFGVIWDLSSLIQNHIVEAETAIRREGEYQLRVSSGTSPSEVRVTEEETTAAKS